MEELQRLAHEGGTAAQSALEAHPLLAYGATLTTVWLGESYLLYLQLGDGDILDVSPRGPSAAPAGGRAPLRGADHLPLRPPGLAGLPDRFPHPQPRLRPGPSSSLSTDGYANAFREDAGFLRVGADLLDLVRQEGLGAVAAGLDSWLAEATEQGSGDDVTVGLLCRLEACQSPLASAPPPGCPTAG